MSMSKAGVRSRLRVNWLSLCLLTIAFLAAAAALPATAKQAPWRCFQARIEDKLCQDCLDALRKNLAADFGDEHVQVGKAEDARALSVDYRSKRSRKSELARRIRQRDFRLSNVKDKQKGDGHQQQCR